jgi:hypothetical protein
MNSYASREMSPTDARGVGEPSGNVILFACRSSRYVPLAFSISVGFRFLPGIIVSYLE